MSLAAKLLAKHFPPACPLVQPGQLSLGFGCSPGGRRGGSQPHSKGICLPSAPQNIYSSYQMASGCLKYHQWFLLQGKALVSHLGLLIRAIIEHFLHARYFSSSNPSWEGGRPDLNPVTLTSEPTLSRAQPRLLNVPGR